MSQVMSELSFRIRSQSKKSKVVIFLAAVVCFLFMVSFVLAFLIVPKNNRVLSGVIMDKHVEFGRGKSRVEFYWILLAGYNYQTLTPDTSYRMVSFDDYVNYKTGDWYPSGTGISPTK